jgi:plasmid stabilization system protein ParE
MRNKSLRITWSKKAVQDLSRIENFISSIFSNKIARKSIKGVRARIKWAAKNPEACPVDPYFVDLPNNIRYTMFKESRITFEVLEDEMVVHRIFDMRQNPVNWKI